MKKNRAIMVITGICLAIVLLGYTVIVGFGETGTGSARNIKLGLDLAGGVSITYQAVEANPTAEQLSDTVYKLQKRVEEYSTEAQVYAEGSNRINIEIPGVSDANAILEELGKPGSLSFQDSSGEVVLEGTDVEDAQGGTQTSSLGVTEYVVQLTLTSEGAVKFAEATAANIGNIIYIIYDDTVISAPTVNTTISNGEAVITGMGSLEEARELASTIRIGGLQLELEEIRSNIVGAQLGEEAIRTSLLAGLIGILIVILFMSIVYRLPGVLSGIALILYVGLTFVLLNAFDITLTLPGIAGIILSIGMAVDANVIIYARIKEEIAAGKNVNSAIKIGFQKALSAILDGNITTLIAAAILGILGSGSVKGFAQTLALGIVLSMFTALVISRLLVNAAYALGFRDVKYYGEQKERKIIPFLSKRKLFFAISIILILVGPVAMLVNQNSIGKTLNYSLEFQGGTSTSVTFNEDMSIADIDAKVKPVIETVTGDSDIQVQKVADSNQAIIKTRELTLTERESLNQALADEFNVDTSLIESESISSTFSSEMRSDAVLAVAIAVVCILIYIWFRFKDIRFGASAVLALIHDVLIVLAFYAVSRISVGSTFIACMLTIVGYSINATIVIFDRIRENLKTMGKKESLEDVCNQSITQTLTRTIYTSFTTFVTIAALYVLGVSSIKDFALPLMIGIVVGAYSSVCITSALWFVLRKKFVKKEE